MDNTRERGLHLISPKVRKFEGSCVRRFFSPKVRKLEIKGSAVRTKRFWSPKVQYSEILKICNTTRFIIRLNS